MFMFTTLDYKKNQVSLIRLAYEHLIYYPTPINIGFFWSFGSLAGIFLVIQIISGVILAAHYTSDVTLAFFSVDHIMRDVSWGWLIRHMHANGASFFFVVVFLHIFRGLYYTSYLYPRRVLWLTGGIIWLLMMATAFIGYVLPWGQMSFWGATVITNFFSVIPFIGEDIAKWIWGGFSVDNPTLSRFFSFHYLFPFLISGLVIVHLGYLHLSGSSNPAFVKSVYNIPFGTYFIIKDLLGIIFFLFLFFFFVKIFLIFIIK
jgi:ubiquinol-cytochrome c reductase cytochrome b/c1 subunit